MPAKIVAGPVFLVAPEFSIHLELWLEEVDYSRAEELLSRQADNRPMDDKVWSEYADMMAQRMWPFTGDTVKLTSDDRVMDGQHRLTGVMESGTTQVFLFARGVEPKARIAMDRPRLRTTNQTFKMEGETNPTILNGALGYIWRALPTYNPKKMRPRPPTVFAKELLQQHPNLRLSTSTGMRLQRLTGKPSLMTYLHYRYSSIDQDDCEDFFSKLTTGAGLQTGDGILTLRTKFEEHARKGTFDDEQWHAFTNKAWNAYRRGVSLPNITWRRGGSRPEPFPEPI